MLHRRHTLSLTAMAALLSLSAGPAQAVEPELIELTQTGCQFVGVEAADHGFATRKAEDCEAVNARSGAERLAAAKTISLTPGKYVFRITNKNVPYELGFWLRGDGLISRTTLPSVSGGGLTEGNTLDYEIELVAGEYVFSCPLNPTPDYRLVVSEG